ncbi:MAG TPA: LysM peptidoglycan-binding domain-containing protein [Polyangiaceae bacterium]|nr:LysM peptidoglycan-binding domain-containing protein [Polyangiaceae bacterium]
MTTLGQAMSVPLALLAGAALASNPRILPADFSLADHLGGKVPQRVSAPPVETPRLAKLGPESPELLALRLAEAQLFEDSQVVEVSELDTQDLPGVAEPRRSAGDIAGIDFLSGLYLPDLPVERHHHVEKYLNYFSSNPTGRGLFSTWLQRSGKYRSIISAALAEQNLPKDLEALVFIESGMWATAKSSAGAVGLWQFMPETARAYGLTVSPQYDERRSIWKASAAAAKHLADLHEHFQSWDLALAAYNFGSGNLEARLSDAAETNFWKAANLEGVLPEETRRYVPKVLAVAVLLNNLDQYGFSAVELDDPLSAVAFEVPPGASLQALARAAGTSVANIKQLNPELLTATIPDRGSPISVHIPKSGLARARVMLPRLLGGDVQELNEPVGDDYDWGSPNGVASTRGVAARAGVDFLGGPTGTKPRSASGAAASVPAGSAGPKSDEEPVRAKAPAPPVAVAHTPARQAPEPAMSVPPVAPPAPPNVSATPASSASPLQVAFVPYRVQRGDSLAKIASRFGVSERELVLDNDIRDRSVIFRGQLIQVRNSSESPERARILYKVRRGDTLERIAQRLRTKPALLLVENEIPDPNLLQVGQIVLVTPG